MEGVGPTLKELEVGGVGFGNSHFVGLEIGIPSALKVHAAV